MIYLHQILLHGKGGLVNPKLPKADVKIYSEAIEQDIEKFNEAYEKAKGRMNKKNIAAIQNHLGTLRSSVKLDSITLRLATQDNMIKSNPLMVSEYVYNLDDSDYVVLRPEEKLITVKFPELGALLALEYAYRDFDVTKEQIEDILKDASIIGPTECDSLIELTKQLSEDCSEDFYTLVCGMQVGDSSYIDKINGGKEVLDYFMTKSFPLKKYNRVLSHSCMIATSYLMSCVISSIRNNTRAPIVPLICGEDRVVYIARDKSVYDSYSILMGGVAIQIFGRKVLLHPEVEVI